MQLLTGEAIDAGFGAKNAFFEPFDALKMIFCQDRLGTNIGKVEKKGALFAGRGELSGLIANLRALMVVVASPIFGRVSLWGRAHGLPGGEKRPLSFFLFPA